MFTGLSTYLAPVVTFIGSTLVPLLFALSFLTLAFGLVRYLIAGGAQPEEQAKGRQLAIYGISGFVLAAIIWGLVNFLVAVFGFTTTNLNTNIVPTTYFDTR